MGWTQQRWEEWLRGEQGWWTGFSGGEDVLSEKRNIGRSYVQFCDSESINLL